MTTIAPAWPEKITICEVGLRDGLQNEKRLFSVDEKLQLLELVVASGIKIIEIGSFVNPKAVPPMAETDILCRQMPKVDGVEYRALVANLKGVQRAHEAGLTKVKLTVSASEAHCRSNLGKTPAQIIAGFADCTEYAQQNGLHVSGAISTAFGCPFEGKVPAEQVESGVRDLLALGITELSLSDTTGMANPRQVYELGSQMLTLFPQVRWVMHFHNTRGMALTNICAGLQAGVSVFDASFAGLGGCPFAPGASGNVATEDVIHMCDEMGIDSGISLTDAIATARLAQQLAGRQAESFVLKAGRCQDIVAKPQ